MTILRTGAEVPDGAVMPAVLTMELLAEKNPVALYELAELARDPSHELFGNTGGGPAGPRTYRRRREDLQRDPGRGPRGCRRRRLRRVPPLAVRTGRGRLMRPFRRRAPRPDPMAFPLLAEAHIAVGSLSGVAPSDIAAHLLITVDHDGRRKLTGSACPELAAVILTELAAGLARRACAAHECGGPETEGARS